MNEPRDPFEEQIRQQLERSCEVLDPATQARLRAARREALSAAAPRVRWIPAAALASLSLLAVAIGLWQSQGEEMGVPMASATSLEDLELLAAQESFEFLEELEFYLWLESQQHEAG